MNNESLPKCPQCGLPLPENAPAGLCPNCLMALNLKTETVFTGDVSNAPPPLTPEQIAPHFPQLEILEFLGRGGMGVVYKARQKTLNRLVALKLLAPERVDDMKFAERFTREAQALAALNHPNIVTIYDFGQAGGFYYLLMEFVDGLNLRQLLRTRKFTPEEALSIVPPLCDALQFAHDRGIVHRDIKPENLLLDKNGRIKVADFGIAKMLGAVNGDGQPGGSAAIENATQTSLGTPGYSAPEQKTDPQRVDSRADIYSLGVVFYEMLTGELPGKPLEPPSKKVQIDVRLDEIVLRALEKKPELRYQQASAMKTQVETIAAESEKAEGRRQKPEGRRALPFGSSFLIGIVVFLLVTVLALIYANILPQTYTATTQLGIHRLVSSGSVPLIFHRLEPAANPSETKQDVFRVQSGVILEPVISKLGLNERWGNKYSGGQVLKPAATLELLKNRISVTAVANTRLLDITCYDDSPAEAAELANAIAEGFQSYEKTNLESYVAWKKRNPDARTTPDYEITDDRVFRQVEITQFARPPLHPFRPNKVLIVVSGAIVGMFLGGAIFLIRLVWCYFRQRSRLPDNEKKKPDRFWRWFAVAVFALIAIPFLISIVGLLAAIAIPNFVKARQQAQKKHSAELAQEGWQLLQTHQLDQAATKFNEAVSITPASADAWNGLGWLDFNSGKTADAEGAFQKALSFQPDHPAALNGMGQINLSQGKYDEAETWLLKAAPQAPAAWFGLARLYLLEGKFDAAETWAQKIVDSGQADETTGKMLEAAKAKKLSDDLRRMIEPPTKK